MDGVGVKVAGDSPLRDDEAEFQKLSVDLGCTPAGILFPYGQITRAAPVSACNLVMF